MRNRRGALWALLAAGAAYAWNHRDQLRQQFESLRGLAPGSTEPSRQPYALPDNSRIEQRDFSAPSTDRAARRCASPRTESRHW